VFSYFRPFAICAAGSSPTTKIIEAVISVHAARQVASEITKVRNHEMNLTDNSPISHITARLWRLETYLARILAN
jgi:hypothetical protein